MPIRIRIFNDHIRPYRNKFLVSIQFIEDMILLVIRIEDYSRTLSAMRAMAPVDVPAATPAKLTLSVFGRQSALAGLLRVTSAIAR
jgi:hypothetical protein